MDLLHAGKLICQRLRESRHTAYFAGGWVRDYLLGHASSSDIDIATSATPDEIIQLFPDHVLVGKEFGVVLVLFGPYQFEVATFREDLEYEDGRKPVGVNLQSSALEDAKRRDFTINGMFYDPEHDKIYDFVGGREDLEKKVIRTIGDPADRFKEDRLRMIRAIRFAHRFHFHLEKNTQDAIAKLSHTLLPAVSMERIWQELTKMRHAPLFTKALIEMQGLGLLPTIFPPLQGLSSDEIAARIKGMETVSSRVPTILFIACLFGKDDRDFVKNLHLYLKAAKEDGIWLETFLKLQDTDLLKLSPYELAKLMASRHFEICFEVFTARLPEKEKEKWSNWHIDALHRLTFYIHRLRKKEPLVTSSDLAQLGIQPGVEMGKLLEKAWQIAINSDIREKNLIIQKLDVKAP